MNPRQHALAIFAAALKRADPRDAVRQALLELDLTGRVWVLGAGKAAAAMAEAAEDVLDRQIAGGAINVKYGHAGSTRKIAVTECGHPVPDAAGVLALAAKVKFIIDPDNPYPSNYTGHIRATLRDGSVVEERQPYLRGGAQEPLTRQDVIDKFRLNAKHGGWSAAQSNAALKLLAGLYSDRLDLSSFRG